MVEPPNNGDYSMCMISALMLKLQDKGILTETETAEILKRTTSADGNIFKLLLELQKNKRG